MESYKSYLSPVFIYRFYITPLCSLPQLYSLYINIKRIIHFIHFMLRTLIFPLILLSILLYALTQLWVTTYCHIIFPPVYKSKKKCLSLIRTWIGALIQMYLLSFDVPLNRVLFQGKVQLLLNKQTREKPITHTPQMWYNCVGSQNVPLISVTVASLPASFLQVPTEANERLWLEEQIAPIHQCHLKRC